MHAAFKAKKLRNLNCDAPFLTYALNAAVDSFFQLGTPRKKNVCQILNNALN